MLTVLKYIALIGTFFIYTTSGVFSKLASQREFLSPGYIAFLGCTVGVLGIYAVLWQQIIKRMDVSLAYMFKGTGVVFGNARTPCVWRGNHHDEHRRGGNHLQPVRIPYFCQIQHLLSDSKFIFSYHSNTSKYALSFFST